MTAEPDIYFGSPGALAVIPHPRGGVQTTRVRSSAVFSTATGGARTSRTLDGKRRYTLNWQQLWYETYQAILAYDQGHNGPGPFVLHDPAQINWLTVNQSAATSHRYDTTGFTVVNDLSEVSDNYTRVATGGWGTATPSGQVWSSITTPTTPASVNGTTGLITLTSTIGHAASGKGGLYMAGTSGNYANTPDNAALDITGDIDLRADISMDDWTPSGTQVLISKWGAGGTRSYLFQVTSTGLLELAWTSNGTNSSLSDSTIPIPVTEGRLCVRGTLDVDNGASGRTVTFYYGPTIDGPWTQLGAAVITATATTIFSGSSPVEIGTQSLGTTSIFTGVVHAAKILNGIGGTEVANPDFDAQTAGTTSFADSAGRTWTVQGTASIISGRCGVGLTTISESEWDLYIDNSCNVTPSGGNVTEFFDLPYVDSANHHRTKVTFTNSGTVTLGAVVIIAGVTTVLQAQTTVTGVTATTALRTRIQRANGLLRAKVYDRAGAEPDAWGFSVAETSLTTAGGLHIAGFRAVGNLSTTAVLSFDNLTITHPNETTTIASSATLVNRGPRALAWTRATNTSGTTAPLLSLDTPSPVWPGIPVIASQALTFSFVARGAGTDAIVTLTPKLVWLDSTGATVSTSSGTPVATSSGAWAAMSVTATPPATAYYVLAKVEMTSGQSLGSIIYLDMFQLERGSAITAWRPGTGILPVTVMSLSEQWPWQASTYRDSPVLVLQEAGA